MRSRSVSGDAVTLADLLASFDALTLVEAPDGLDGAVDEVVIFDREDTASVRRRALVLAVATPASGDDALALLDLAAEAEAAAIAFRGGPGFSDRLRDRAARRGVALLAVAPGMRWDQLLSLIQVALAPTPLTAGGPADLVALADELAVAARAAVTIEDPRWRVLAYANHDRQIDEARRQTILGRLPPSAWRAKLDAAGVLQRLRNEDAPFHLHLGDAAPRLVAPVRAGGELLGSLWLVADGEPLGEEAEQALRRFAPIAAVHLIANRAAEQIERRVRSASVRELLDGRLPHSDGAAPALRSRGPFTVVAFAPDEPGPWRGDPARLLSILSLYAESVDTEAMCTVLGERLWALVRTPAGAAREALVDLASRVVAHAGRATGTGLLAGIGVSVPSVAQIPRSRRAAERVLDIVACRAADEPHVAHADDLRAQILIMEIVSLAAELPELREGAIARLAAAEPEGLRTVRAFLDAHGDVKVAGQIAGVHPNTMRYRIRRLQRLYGLDLSDPDVRLLAFLETRILDRANRE